MEWTFEPDSRASFMIRKTSGSRRPRVSVSLPPPSRVVVHEPRRFSACVDALFVFVVEASFRERSKNVREKKLAPPPRPGTRRLIQSTGLRASPPKLRFSDRNRPAGRTSGLCSAPNPKLYTRGFERDDFLSRDVVSRRPPSPARSPLSSPLIKWP